MKKILLIMLMFCLTIVGVSAEHTFTYPNYFDVNVSEEILITNADEITGQTAFLFLGGSLTEFNKINSNTSFQLYVTGTEEGDETYFIQVYNSSIGQEQINSSDGSRESFLTVDNQTMYGFYVTSSDAHTIGSFENHEVCINLKKQTGSPIIKTFIGYDNGTEIIYTNSSTSHLVVNTNYEFICLDTTHIYQHNVTIYNESFGVWCTNCDGSNSIRLGIDTTVVNDSSFRMESQGSTIINNTVNNYMLINLELDGEALEEYTGVFKFRIPFYYTFQLFNQFNTSLSTQFDYVYLEENSLSSSTDLASVGTDLSNALNVFSSLLSSTSLDTTEVFWDDVTTDTATIKLYEAGNYSVNLLTVKSFVVNGWDYEFLKPQYTKSKIETKIINRLDVNNEINSTVKVALSEYEANKKGFWLNAIKWIFLIMLLVLGIVISFMSDAPFKVAGAVLFIWTLLVKLIGGINL